MIIDSSMAVILFLGLLIAVLLSTHTFYREATNGTLFLLLSKPVPRYLFVLAKISGMLAVLSFFVITCGIAMINSISISVSQFETNMYNMLFYYCALALASLWGAYRDYFRGRVFTQSASMGLMFFLFLQAVQNAVLPLGSYSTKAAELQVSVIPSLLLLLFAIWIMGAITVVLGTRFNVIINLLVSFPIYLIGLISNYLFVNSLQSSFICKFFYAVIPNWQFFWTADAVSNGIKIPEEYIFFSFLYTIFYIAICIITATLLFKNKEPGDSRL
ncbi:MAG: ABC transporter permease [Victivallales bacterium]|nr:ABC transporter permease [Victivallales bacterium]MCF7889120.1 ABC transporter permease [Victivallales bacterium]